MAKSNTSSSWVDRMSKSAVDEGTPLLQHHHGNLNNVPPTREILLPANNNNPITSRRTITRLVSWDNYVQHLEKRPLLVKSITATFILGGADLCGQAVEHFRGSSVVPGVDWPRAARFAAFGLFGTPWSHYYYHWLDQYLPPSPDPWTVTTAVKVFIDQFIQAPLLLAVMICALSLMKGQGIKGAKHDMKENFVVALIANCKYMLFRCSHVRFIFSLNTYLGINRDSQTPLSISFSYSRETLVARFGGQYDFCQTFISCALHQRCLFCLDDHFKPHVEQ